MKINEYNKNKLLGDCRQNFIEDMINEGKARMREFSFVGEDASDYGKPDVSFMVSKDKHLYPVISINALYCAPEDDPTAEKLYIAYDYDFTRRKPSTIGTIYGYANKERRYVTTLNVISQYRGTGVGGYLMHSMSEEFLRYFPGTDLLLDCDKSQDPYNEEKYANWGFKQDGKKMLNVQPMKRKEEHPLVKEIKEIWLKNYMRNFNEAVSPDFEKELNEMASKIKGSLTEQYREQQEFAKKWSPKR